MGVNLQKGQKIDLTKTNQGLKRIRIGLGWDAASGTSSGGGGGIGGFLGGLFGGGGGGANIDCDASVFLIDGQSGKLNSTNDIICFSNLRHSSGAVTHMGDNLTGDGDGDDEQIMVELPKLPSHYGKIIFVVNIFAARERKQHFGMIKNAYIRLVDADKNSELCRYNLSEDYSGMLAMIFGELYLHQNEWKFNAMGQGTQDNNITALADRYR